MIAGVLLGGIPVLCVSSTNAFAAETSPVGKATLKRDVEVYNQAIQAYQQGDLSSATVGFQQAASSDDDVIAAKARYNLGNAFFAQSMGLAAQPQQDEDNVANQIDLLGRAVEAYRSCLRLDRNDKDARFNIELAAKRIQQLESPAQDESKNSDNEDSKKEQPEDSDQQDGNQQPSDAQPNDEPSPENEDDSQQSDQSQTNAQPEQDGQSNSPEQNQQPDEKTESGKQDSQSNNSGEPESEDPSADQQSNQQPPTPEDPAEGELSEAEPTEPDPNEEDPDEGGPELMPSVMPNAEGEMSQEEALKLLQAIRDRDMLRRMQLETQRRSRRVAVPKDW